VGVAWVTWPNVEILGPPYNFWTNIDIRFKFGIDIENGPLLRVDQTIKRPLSGCGLGHVTQFRNFGTHYNFWKNRAIRFKFGRHSGRTCNITSGPTPGFQPLGDLRDQSGKLRGSKLETRKSLYDDFNIHYNWRSDWARQRPNGLYNRLTQQNIQCICSNAAVSTNQPQL